LPDAMEAETAPATNGSAAPAAAPVESSTDAE
jgi:hypothetical protein